MKTKPPLYRRLAQPVVWSLFTAAATAQPLADDFEAGSGLWTATGQWGLTNAKYASPSHAVTDSPGAFYANLSDSSLTLAGALDLSGTERPALAFRHAFHLESGYDFGMVEISTDGGATWQPAPLASYTGTMPGMTREQIDLTAFAAETHAKIRFHMTTDASVVMDGWYVDDVTIGSAPEPVAMETPDSGDVSQTSVTLRWNASPDPGFSAYVILRGTQAGFDWHTAKTVATITDSAMVETTDIAVAPKSGYRYKVMVLTNVGLHSLSNEIAVTTPAGMDYPFLDDAEGGPNCWVATSPWAVSDEDFHSAGHAWSDSPGGNYADGIASQPLTLAAPLDLSAAVDPVLTFSHRYALASGDTANVEVSLNHGSSWSSLATYSAGSADWRSGRIPLAAYAGQPSVLLRFRLTTSASANADGWHLDNISAAEAPATVATPAISEIASHSLRLTWSANSSLPFSHYAVHRSTSPGVDCNSERVATIDDQSVTTFTDTGLAHDTIYYYRIYAVSPYGTYSADSTAEASARTLNHQVPFAENFDENLLAWNTGGDTGTSAWGLSSDVKHAGASSLASSPGASYAQNSNTWIETSIDLSGADWPVLTFWDKYGLNSGDWIRLEVSATGGSATNVYGACVSSRPDWRRQQVDLSPWKGLANVRLRFRIYADNAATPGEGWFIDDLTVFENPDSATPAALPVTEDFESADSSQWLAAGWHPQSDPSAIDGARSVRNTDGDYMPPDSQHWMTLARPLVLPAGSRVQATYWLRGRLNYRSYFRLQYSTSGGSSWTDLSAVNINYDYLHDTDWTRWQADLSALAGGTVRLRCCTISNGNPVSFIHLDKLTIGEMPAAVVSQPIDQISVTSLRLNWIPSTLPEFRRYRIYRSSSNTVTTDSTLIAEIDDAGTGSFVDTGLEARKTYYYRIHVVDDRDTHSPSDIMSATTLGLTLPLTEDFESGLDGWTLTGGWQLLAGVGHGGGSALVDSAGDYEASTDTSASFAVDLTGMDWPVLRFRDKHAFAGSSWGRLEFSTDGTSWGNFLYSVTGTRNEWHEQAIDLSFLKQQSRVFIRFRRATDSNLADGWTIDDLTITENTAPPVYPVWDGFESDSGLWLKSRWTPVSANPKDGSSCLDDSPEGRYGPDVQNQLVLARELDLTHAVDPKLSFHLRGQLFYRSYFRAHISTDGGLNWSELGTLNINYDYNQPDTWVFKQASLAAWAGQRIRLRFVTSASGQPDSGIVLDNIGIGEAAPSSPVPVSPFQNETVEIVRPTLTVNNAIDYQSDALTHQFEVYADAALTQLVAQIPSVASGATTTSWQVDVDLPDHAPYWWRARASDGTNAGEWSAPVVFNINEFNNPPLPVMVASPANDSLLIDGNGLLVWFQTSDPDLGDQVLDYQIQIDDDHMFGSPEVDVSGVTVESSTYGPGYFASIPLGSLAGSGALPSGRWFWRIRARDTRFSSGAWPDGYAYFRLPTFYQRYLRSLYPDPDWFLHDVSNPGADPDGNGVGVLVEFASAIAPGDDPGDRLPVAIELDVSGQNHQGFEFTRRKNSELDFLLDVSTDLEHWQPDTRASVEVLHSVDDISERVRLIDPDPVGSHRKRFIRLRVRD